MPALLTLSDDEAARLLVCLSFASANRDDMLEAVGRVKVTEDVVFVGDMNRRVEVAERDLEHLTERLLAAVERDRQARFSAVETGRTPTARPPITDLPVERPPRPAGADGRTLLLRAVLNAIVEMRDKGATAAADSVLPGGYECFDDWAADMAAAALAADSTP